MSRSQRKKWILMISFLIVYAIGSANTNVRLVFSYSYNFPTFKRVRPVIQDFINSHKDVNFDIDFLDSKNVFNPTYDTVLYNNLKIKYASIPRIDMVIAADDNALKFVNKYHKTLFNGAPVIFWGINNIDTAIRYSKIPNYTGIAEQFQIEKTIDLIKKIDPSVDEIIAIADKTETSKTELRNFFDIASKYHPTKFSVYSLENMFLSTLLEKIDKIYGHKAFLLLGAYTDKSGTNLPFYSTLQAITDKAHVPVYHTWLAQLGNGIAGGVFSDHQLQAKEAFDIASQILDGKDIKAFPLKTNIDMPAIVDREVLSKYGYSTENLGSGVIVNNDITFRLFDKHNKPNVLFYTLLMLNLVIVALIIWMLHTRRIKYLLKEDKNKFEVLFHQNKAIMLIIDPITKRIVEGNLQATNFFGYSQKEYKSKTISFTQILEPKSIKTGLNSLTQAIDERVLLKSINKNQETNDIEMYIGGITLKNKKLQLAIIHDISDRVKAKIELSEAFRKAEESDKLKNAFLLNLSHEYRTPLNAIIGFSEFMLNEEELNETSLSYLNIIKNSGEGLLMLLESITDLARIQSDTIAISMAQTDLAAMIYHIKPLINTLNTANNENIIFKTQTDSRIKNFTFETDELIVKQVIFKLLNNAFKFTHAGEIVLESHVDVNTDMVMINVSDTGPGISDEIRERIFENFYRDEDQMKSKDGLGIGLAVSRGLIIAIGGNLSVQSDGKSYSKFTITLPYKNPVFKATNQN